MPLNVSPQIRIFRHDTYFLTNFCFVLLLVCGYIFLSKKESVPYLGKCVSAEEWRFLEPTIIILIQYYTARLDKDHLITQQVVE